MRPTNTVPCLEAKIHLLHVNQLGANCDLHMREDKSMTDRVLGSLSACAMIARAMMSSAQSAPLDTRSGTLSRL